MACPEGVVVELRDYGTEGSAPDVLATDGAAVSEVAGPFDDRVAG
jgi:hypothetical protein